MSAASSDESLDIPITASHSTAPTSPAGLVGLSNADLIKECRPSFHVLPATGWMNDPCAPFYDARTELYHVSFQWNPDGPDWGDITWGSATSSDMISWTIKDQPILAPGMPYDRNGVWTGCVVPCQDGSLTCAYTSIESLPIAYTIPHQRGFESLSLAKSFDSGKTWHKSADNPILPGEPEGLDVTGWRDPFCAPWPTMSRCLGLDPENTLFGLMSGGIRHVSPTAFLYKINTSNVSEWEYLWPLVTVGLNARLSRWSGDLGKNWEVANFMTLYDENDASIAHEFLFVGAEGCFPDDEMASETKQWRPARRQLWLSGPLCAERVARELNAVELEYKFGGHLDHGCFYAANSFFDPKSQRHVVWGWITEEDLCDTLRHQQGWSGMLSMPRELFMQTLHNVVGASNSNLSAVTSIEAVQNGHGSFSVRTLASRPYLPLIKSLRQAHNARQSILGRAKLGTVDTSPVGFTSESVKTTRWELDCSFKVSKRNSQVGVRISHAQDMFQATTLTFQPRSETFTIDRPMLVTDNSSKLFNSAPESAPHTLFTTRDPLTGKEDVELLHIQAWQDNSVLEVFVNSRTVISTRLYAAKETFSMTFFAADDEPKDNFSCSADTERTEIIAAVLWDDIGIA